MLFKQLFKNHIIGYTLLLILAWSVIVGVSLYRNIDQEQQQALLLATEAARANFNKDQAYRLWASSHGGVYVYPNERTPPSPYMAHLPKRDITTTDGKMLTLMNPAYMLRQMMEDYDKLYGVKGKITGRIVLNPINTADEWELMALDKLEMGAKEVVEETVIEDKHYLRLMRPMVMRDSCIKCHGHLGFKVGDLRGGVDVAVPMAPYISAMEEKLKTVFASHGSVWLMVTLGMLAVSRRSWIRNNERMQLIEELEMSDEVFRSVTNALLITDKDSKILRVNSFFSDITGFSQADVQGKTPAILNSGQHDKAFFKNMWHELNKNGRWQGEIINQRKDGGVFTSWQNISTVYNEQGGVSHYVAAFEDISERKEMENELRHHRDNLAEMVKEKTASINAIVDTAADAIITIDKLGNILSFNHAAEEMFQYSMKEVQGKNVNVLIPEPEHSAHDGYLAAYKGNTKNSTVIGKGREVYGRRKDGSTFPLYIAVSEMTIANERRFTGIITDITDQKRNEAELIRAREEAEASNQAKSAFLANMSHEIRTPMNAIIGMTDLVLDSALQTEQEKHLRAVASSARSLLILLNDILDLSKLEGGKLVLEVIPFSIRQLLDSVADVVQVSVQAKKLALEFDIDESIPCCVMGDPTRLRQVVINLVGNAIKFTEKGKILVSVKAGEREGYWHFSVKDTGVGIAADRVDKVFERFSQADDSTTRQFGGTGLGTTISRELVERMDGRIWVESEEGRGSDFQFTVKLPVAEGITECDTYIGTPSINSASYTRPLRILLAEDVLLNQELVSIRLTERGHTVVVAENGRIAVEMFKEGDFDLILMDVMMPELDGLEATKAIRALEKKQGSRIPIIMLTASVMQADRKKYIAAGADSFVAKPIDFVELFNTIAQYFPVLELSLEQNEGTGGENALPELAGIDTHEALAIWGNVTTYRDVLKEFSQDYVDTSTQLTHMFNDHLFDDAAFLAHTVKGVALNLGVRKVAEVLGALEQCGKNKNPDVAPLLAELNEYMAVVVQSIEQLFESKVSTVASRVVTEPEQSHLLLERLQLALKRSEVDERGLEELSKVLETKYMQQLERLIDSFEFEQATDYVDELQEKIKIGIFS